jgi:hypothetical protein
LTSALAGDKLSASRPCRFTPGERAPRTHWLWDWVDPRAGLDDSIKQVVVYKFHDPITQYYAKNIMIVTYSVNSEALRSKTGDMQIFASALEDNLVEYQFLMERKYLVHQERR